MPRALLIDLGGTLVEYYHLSEFPGILSDAIGRITRHLDSIGRARPDDDLIAERTAQENHEASDHAVRPLEQRLGRIFSVDEGESVLLDRLSAIFMEPIFERAKLYDDVIPSLRSIRDAGIATVIVSNTPWGSPSALWLDELRRHRLLAEVDAAFFCRDAGWRKPAEPIFHHVLQRLGLTPGETLFVGDDPRWDLVGPRRVGIEPILISRDGTTVDVDCRQVRSMSEVAAVVRMGG